MKPRSIGRVHVITDESLQDRWSHIELARLAVSGGADSVQFREKRSREVSDLVSLARAICHEVKSGGARCLVNDRVDVALASGADGVHLGSDDMATDRARRELGESAIVGATANTLKQAIEVSRMPVDYLGVGPVFGTASKSNPAPALGLDSLERIVEAVEIPVIAIGNITVAMVSEVLGTGAYGIAVLSAVVLADDPAKATAELSEAIQSTLRGVGDETGIRFTG